MYPVLYIVLNLATPRIYLKRKIMLLSVKSAYLLAKFYQLSINYSLTSQHFAFTSQI